MTDPREAPADGLWDDPEAVEADRWVDEARNEEGRVWPGDGQEEDV